MSMVSDDLRRLEPHIKDIFPSSEPTSSIAVSVDRPNQPFHLGRLLTLLTTMNPEITTSMMSIDCSLSHMCCPTVIYSFSSVGHANSVFEVIQETDDMHVEFVTSPTSNARFVRVPHTAGMDVHMAKTYYSSYGPILSVVQSSDRGSPSFVIEFDQFHDAFHCKVDLDVGTSSVVTPALAAPGLPRLPAERGLPPSERRVEPAPYSIPPPHAQNQNNANLAGPPGLVPPERQLPPGAIDVIFRAAAEQQQRKLAEAAQRASSPNGQPPPPPKKNDSPLSGYPPATPPRQMVFRKDRDNTTPTVKANGKPLLQSPHASAGNFENNAQQQYDWFVARGKQNNISVSDYLDQTSNGRSSFSDRQSNGGLAKSPGSSGNFARLRKSLPMPESRKEQYAVDLEAIKSGKDTRTTIMVQNIPSAMTVVQFSCLIDRHFKDKYDFVYLPRDANYGAALGYVFLNFKDVKDVIDFYNAYNDKSWEGYKQCFKKCKIAYGRIQGVDLLMAHFKDKSVFRDLLVCPRFLDTNSKTFRRDQFKSIGESSAGGDEVTKVVHSTHTKKEQKVHASHTKSMHTNPEANTNQSIRGHKGLVKAA